MLIMYSGVGDTSVQVKHTYACAKGTREILVLIIHQEGLPTQSLVHALIFRLIPSVFMGLA